MDWSSQRDLREMLSGLRLCLQAVQPPGAITMVINGNRVNDEIAQELCSKIARLERLVVPKGNPHV